jgi:hypothetical protein
VTLPATSSPLGLVAMAAVPGDSRDEKPLDMSNPPLISDGDTADEAEKATQDGNGDREDISAEEAPEYITGITLVAVMGSTVLAAFLMLLDMSVIVTVSTIKQSGMHSSRSGVGAESATVSSKLQIMN